MLTRLAAGLPGHQLPGGLIRVAGDGFEGGARGVGDPKSVLVGAVGRLPEQMRNGVVRRHFEPEQNPGGVLELAQAANLGARLGEIKTAAPQIREELGIESFKIPGQLADPALSQIAKTDGQPHHRDPEGELIAARRCGQNAQGTRTHRPQKNRLFSAV